MYFFHRIMGDEGEKWVKREDVGIGGAGADLGAEEVSRRSLVFLLLYWMLCAGNERTETVRRREIWKEYP